MRAVALALAIASVSTDALAARPRIDDPVLRDVEQAYSILRADRPAAANRARIHLARAAAALDDLADPRDSLEAALGGDDNAPWRGLPHERVFVLLTLAALDVDADRCDLALPTLKNALHHRDRGRLQHGQVASQVNDTTDLTLALVLRARCALVAGVGDPDAARAALRGRSDGEALLSAATARALVLDFAGRAPTIIAAGAHGEQGQLVWESDGAPAFSITIGRALRSSSSVSSSSVSPSAVLVHDLKDEALPPGPAATARRATQATQKSQLSAQATGYASRGQAAARDARDARGVIGAGFLLASAAGLAATTTVVDARVDTRTAPSMPRQISVRPAD